MPPQPKVETPIIKPKVEVPTLKVNPPPVKPKVEIP